VKQTKLYQIYKFFSSIRLAVILIVMLGGMLATATYYESVYDTKTAQHLVYQSKFFAAFLGLLFINIFCSTSIRYPWKKHQVGFVITHLGILLLLIGSAVTMVVGVEGSLSIEEGNAASRILMDQPIFMIGSDGAAMREVPAEFRWIQPTEAKPAKVALGKASEKSGELEVEVLRYLHHARANLYHVEDANSNVAALKLRLKNSRFDQVEWMTVGKGEVSLGPATVMLKRLASDKEVADFQKPPLEVEQRGELQLLINERPSRLSLSGLTEGKWIDLDNSTYKLKLVQYLCHAIPQNGKLVNKSDKPVNPMAEVEIQDGQGNRQTWLLFARLPELNTMKKLEGTQFPVRLLYSFEGSKAKHHLTLASDTQGRLYSQVDEQAGKPVELGKAYPTGWMDIQFSAEAYLPHAREVKDYSEVKVEKGMDSEGPSSAVFVRVNGSDRKEPFWLERGDVVQLGTSTTPSSKIIFGYAYKSMDLGLKFKLKKFEIDYDPGSRSAAAYRSTLEVEGQDHLVQMNEPLVKNGYKIFQSSFVDIEGQPKISILTVAKDPGIGLKYFGSILLVSGIFTMFYLKPYQLKNRSQASEKLASKEPTVPAKSGLEANLIGDVSGAPATTEGTQENE
jgi:hypothetical protein